MGREGRRTNGTPGKTGRSLREADFSAAAWRSERGAFGWKALQAQRRGGGTEPGPFEEK